MNRSALTSDDRIIIASSLLPFEVDRKDTIDENSKEKYVIRNNDKDILYEDQKIIYETKEIYD